MTGAPAEPFIFDQRPGALEATRGAARPLAVGHRVAQGWRVELLRDGVALAQLSIEEARALACELGDLAALLEHGWQP